MADFRIFETEHYSRRLEIVFASQLPRVLVKLHTQVYSRLKEQPYFGPHIKKLKGIFPETWRYRIGDYRLFYSIDDQKNIVFLLDIVHRSNAYD